MRTPLTGSATKLVRLSKPRNPNRAECPTCPVHSARELQPVIDLASAVEAPPATVAAVVADAGPLPQAPAALEVATPTAELFAKAALAEHTASEEPRRGAPKLYMCMR